MREEDGHPAQVHLGVLPVDQIPDALFVGPVDERVEQDDDEPAHAQVHEPLHLPPHLIFVERDEPLRLGYRCAPAGSP